MSGVYVPGERARRLVTRALWVAVGLFVLGLLPVALLAGTAGPAASWGVVVAFLAVAALAWRFAVRPARRGGGLTSPVVQVAEDARPVPVPEKVDGPVQACMRCGSRDLATPGLADGVFLGGGELQFLVCRDCNTRAPPLRFERGEDYVAFLEGLRD